MRNGIIVCFFALLSATTGCVVTDGPYNQPSQEKLQIESPTPQSYTVQVIDNVPLYVGADGRVVVDIPRVGRSHTTYLFGAAKVKESSAEDIAAVFVQKGGRTVRRLSINDIRSLPMDSMGYRVVKVN